MRELEWPFDGELILKTKKKMRRELLEDNSFRVNKNIAILGGSTTHGVMEILELFLLNAGIKPNFYECEYNMYKEELMFDNEALKAFAPDIIYIHTSNRNIKVYPAMSDSKEATDALLESTFDSFKVLWEKAFANYHCPIIQNNFEAPFYRLMGNRDASDIHGHVNFVNRLNMKFAEYAASHENFFLQDINYMSSLYGLAKWSDPFYWHMYKYALAVPAIPELAYNLSNIIKSIFGKNKKALMLDLDNTLWGGVVGDDGPENIEIGQETSMGQLYSEFQGYVKAHKDLGILLTVNSKNDEANALAGLSRPDSVLKPEDFIVIKANWENKDQNAKRIAKELNIGEDAIVFVDDNPAERSIVRECVKGVAVPELSEAEHYIQCLDRAGFFEITNLSADDLKRNEMYKENLERANLEASFENYEDYLKSLEMKGEIKPFTEMYMARIAQLTNKSNQFNLTTKRCTQAEIEELAANPSYVTLYGKLVDKFGDNGVVSVVFGHIDGSVFHIDLWLMSCRVLKRDFEFAMMDELVKTLRAKGIETVKGYYYPTAKNGMVREFYSLHGFEKVSEDKEGNTVWERSLSDYANRNHVIEVNK